MSIRSLVAKFQMRLIKTGKVDQHTAEYQAELKKLGIVLPKVAFAKTTPNFVVDITKLPTKILYDYGFIPIGQTQEEVAAETLLSLSNRKKSPAPSQPISAGHLH